MRQLSRQHAGPHISATPERAANGCARAAHQNRQMYKSISRGVKMFLRRTALSFVSIAFIILLSAPLRAQSGIHPKPTPTQEEETERVYTEEVRIPVFAFDEKGHFDPHLVTDDVLVV